MTKQKMEFHEVYKNGKSVQGYKLDATGVDAQFLDEMSQILRSQKCKCLEFDVAVKFDSRTKKTYLLVKVIDNTDQEYFDIGGLV